MPYNSNNIRINFSELMLMLERTANDEMTAAEQVFFSLVCCAGRELCKMRNADGFETGRLITCLSV